MNKDIQKELDKDKKSMIWESIWSVFFIVSYMIMAGALYLTNEKDDLLEEQNDELWVKVNSHQGTNINSDTKAEKIMNISSKGDTTYQYNFECFSVEAFDDVEVIKKVSDNGTVTYQYVLP